MYSKTNLSSKVYIFLTLLLLFQLFSYYSPTSAGNIAVVKVDKLNVRSGPGIQYDVSGTISRNEKYEIVSKEREWVELKLTSSKTGWVANWLINEKQVTTLKNELVRSTVDGLRVRTGPGTSFQTIGYIYLNETFKKLSANDTWIKIEYKGSEAWVSSQYMSTVGEENQESTANESTTTNTALIQADILNIRSQPSTSAEIIGKLTAGDTVTFTNISNGWYEIIFKNSKGWIAGEYVQEDGKQLNHTTKPSEDSLPSDKKGKVTATILNVRKSPEIGSEIITKIKLDETVTIASENGKWYQIQHNNGTGWVSNEYVELLDTQQNAATNLQQKIDGIPYVTILHNGTNLRKEPTTKTDVIARADQGDRFPIVNKTGDWFEVSLPDNRKAFLAGWIVSTSGSIPSVHRPGMEQYLKGKTIIIDPGHGGRDSGTTGKTGTHEKHITLRTAKLLADKLKAAGAKVILTRSDDRYITLNYRVSISHYYNADAFISIHYDSTTNSSVNGISSFYYDKTSDLPLAKKIQTELIKTTKLKDREVKFGNYSVIRENKQPSVLLELGFLSNQREEYTVSTDSYQEKATQAIFTGLAQYFKDN